MKYILLLLLFNQVHRYALGTINVSKRQFPDPSGLGPCLAAYGSLSDDEQRCITDSYNPTLGGLLSPSDFSGVCTSEFCMDVLARLLDSCRVAFQSLLPVDYQDISSEMFVALFCANDFSGIPCYSQLPLNTDVLLSCQSVLTGDICNTDCRRVLTQYNTTCCFASLLSLQPNVGSEQLSQLWRICGLTSSPIMCDIPRSASSSSNVVTDNIDRVTSVPPDDDDDESAGSKEAYIAAGVGGFLVLVIIIAVIIGIIVMKSRRSTSRFSMNSGDVMRMPLPTEDPDD